MSGSSVRVIVLNGDETIANQLRSSLLAAPNVKIAAEIDEVVMLEQALGQFSAEVLLMNLDCGPEEMIDLASQVNTARPDLAIFGISEHNDSQQILSAMRAGMREYLIWPLDQPELDRAFSRISAAPTSSHAGHIVAVMGSVGGVGTTTLASNLACELAQLGRKSVVLVDMDFRLGHIASMLDMSPQFTIADLCETLTQLDDKLLEKALVKHDCGVHVLARPNQISQGEHITAANVAMLVNSLTDMFEYVILDGPHRLDPTARAVLDLADGCLLCMHMLVTSVRNATRILQDLSQNGYNLGRIETIVTRNGRDSGNLELDQVEKTIKKKIFWSIPDDWKTVSTAINLGEPLLTHAPRSKVRESIRDLAEALHDPEGYEQRKKEKSKGLLATPALAKLFSK